MKYDKIIIGGGLSGLFCGIALAEAGKKCLILSQGQSTLNFSSASLEFAGSDSQTPFESLLEQLPANHPYHKIGASDLFLLRAQVAGIFERAGIEMYADIRHNHYRVTPLGLLKATWISLDEMAHFDEDALPEKVLVAGIKGYLDFNVDFVASGLAAKGIQARVCEVSIAEFEKLRENASEFRSANLARVLEGYAVDRLANAINEQIKDEEYILLPAIFGLENAQAAYRMLSKLDRPAAFVPTMSPSVPGIRLQQQLKKRFQALGGTFVSGDNVISAQVKDGKIESITSERHSDSCFYADHFVFACGSFFSNGLKATENKIYEPILGLDMDYNGQHGEWFNSDVYGEQPYMSFGVKTDAQFRVSHEGQTLTNAYAVGQILSGASPLKTQCQGGLSAVSGLHVAQLIIKAEENERQ